MQLQCQDNYQTHFNSFADMLAYHCEQSENSLWKRCAVNELQVSALDSSSPLLQDLSAFADGVSRVAVEDTTQNLGLALNAAGELYPLRATAYKSLLDRAKIGGSALPKLSRKTLAEVLNPCLKLYSSEALLLIRDEKVSAVHSGDESDYAVLPIDKLLEAIDQKLDARFPGNEFEFGYADHSLCIASWKLVAHKTDLLGAYEKLLNAYGLNKTATEMVPAVRFITSDTGISSVKVAAMLVKGDISIHIGSCIDLEHRHAAKVSDFDASLDRLFAQFGDNITKLQSLLDVYLDYPVNAMTRVCKKLVMPKKAALEAIRRYELTYGGGMATAHDVFFALQEIPFLLKTEGVSESKLLAVQENLSRASSLNWSEYDLAKAVNY